MNKRAMSTTSAAIVFELDADRRGTGLSAIVSMILGALHHSRRLQARRILREYEHLIDGAHAGLPIDTSL
jgi:hypothetical protein